GGTVTGGTVTPGTVNPGSLTGGRDSLGPPTEGTEIRGSDRPLSPGRHDGASASTATTPTSSIRPRPRLPHQRVEDRIVPQVRLGPKRDRHRLPLYSGSW